jgi:hypothetical protein
MRKRLSDTGLFADGALTVLAGDVKGFVRARAGVR